MSSTVSLLSCLLDGDDETSKRARQRAIVAELQPQGALANMLAVEQKNEDGDEEEEEEAFLTRVAAICAQAVLDQRDEGDDVAGCVAAEERVSQELTAATSIADFVVHRLRRMAEQLPDGGVVSQSALSLVRLLCVLSGTSTSREDNRWLAATVDVVRNFGGKKEMLSKEVTIWTAQDNNAGSTSSSDSGRPQTDLTPLILGQLLGEWRACGATSEASIGRGISLTGKCKDSGKNL